MLVRPVSVIVGLCALAAIYVGVCLSLQQKADNCRHYEISTETTAKVVSYVGGIFTVEIPWKGTTKWCSFLLPYDANVTIVPGTDLVVYRSDDGGCAATAQDDNCSSSLKFFLLVFTLVGAPTGLCILSAVIDVVLDAIAKCREPKAHIDPEPPLISTAPQVASDALDVAANALELATSAMQQPDKVVAINQE